MRFSHKDKKNVQIETHSTFALAFPDKVSEAPVSCGVFLLLNDTDDVLFVGQSQSDLKSQVADCIGRPEAENCVAYRWFNTHDSNAADELAVLWIDKYLGA